MTPIIFLFLSVVKTRSYHLNPTWMGEKKKQSQEQAGREAREKGPMVEEEVILGRA